MTGLATAAFAFLVGMTVAGLAGSIMQIATGRSPGFVEPYITKAFIARSLLAALVAGPMMLGNDALAAWQARRVAWWTLVVALLLSTLWACLTGVVVMEIAARMTRPL